ncbi:MAG: RagB/SusD family nutrient uptake outer membrane protein [Gemmatimonadaceae bacterium]|nr:RagB/SusD family nutrient uptake outer membrane protein [Gemmatimonadaceae bacterium]
MRRLSSLVAAAALAACSAETVLNPNAPTISGVDADVRAAVQIRASGAMAAQRGNIAAYVSAVGILGRESFNYTPTEARNTTEFLRTAALTNASFVAGGQWAGRYSSMLGLKQLAELVDATAGNTLTPTERSAVKGFANTLWALDMYYVIATRDSLGAPTDIIAVRDSAAAFQTRDSVYRFILGKLNEAKTQLQGGGGAFPFVLTGGFAGLNTPSTFLKLNRAIFARVSVISGSLKGTAGAADYTAALTALTESFLDTSAPMSLGAYYVYSTATGDALNGLSPTVSADQLLHPSLEADAATELRVDGSPDLRYSAKVNKLATARTAPQSAGIATTLQNKIYPTNTTSVPMIRNEELILLRAEANLGLGNLGPALDDINLIRATSGGLAASPLTATSGSNAILTELLRQRRLSLLLEGHRWVDVRRHNRMNTLPLDQTSHIYLNAFPVPTAECDARTLVIRRIGASANTPYTGLAAPSCPAVTI